MPDPTIEGLVVCKAPQQTCYDIRDAAVDVGMKEVLRKGNFDQSTVSFIKSAFVDMSSFLNNSRSLTAICLVMFLALSCQNAPSDAPAVTPIEAHLQEVLRIGDDEEAGLEYLFAWPQNIVTDSQGNIYVADRERCEIKVYDEAGVYLRTLGAKGGGPAEFQDFKDMTITAEDVLVAGDVQNSRITTFTPDGDLHNMHRLDDRQLPFMRSAKMIPLADGTFVLLTAPNSTQPNSDKLFHHYTSDFQQVLGAFGPKELFSDLTDYMYDSLVSMELGSVWVEGQRLFYAPQYYKGEIHVFEQQANSSGWRASGTFSGHVHQQEAITMVSEDEMNDASAGFLNQDKRFGAVFHNESAGLWRLSTGHLVHFTFIRDGDEHVFGVEIYGAENQLLGYGELERIEGYGPFKTGIVFYDVVWKDDKDQFYFIRRDLPSGMGVVAYTLEYALPGE